MLVRVSQKYYGTFGVFNEDTNSIIQKDNTSAPFEMDDALALSHIRKGILVDAAKSETEQEPDTKVVRKEAPEELPEEIPQDIPEDIPEEIPDGIPEELPDAGEDLENITDYKVLKEMAKKAGVNPFGKNKEELRAAIREAQNA